MNKRRPTLKETDEPGLDYRATYFRVFDAIARRRQLVHGRLYNDHNSCAIGCYFRDANIPINSRAIDEIASYNDSFPHLSMHLRWKKVRQWLRFEIARMKKQK